MIYLYVSNEEKNEIVYKGKDKYIKINIKYVNNKFDFEEYIFNIREDQLDVIPNNFITKHIIIKACTNKRNVVKQLGACHNLSNKVYFV